MAFHSAGKILLGTWNKVRHHRLDSQNNLYSTDRENSFGRK